MLRAASVVAVLIASEGDERLARMVDVADGVALVVALFLLVILVVGAMRLRAYLGKRSSTQVLNNAVFVLALVASAGCYYLAFRAIDIFAVKTMIRRRAGEASLDLHNADREVAKLASDHADHLWSDPLESPIHIGWLALLCPVVVIPATIFLDSRRRTAASIPGK